MAAVTIPAGEMTRWESESLSRWGRYITDEETRVLRAAQRAAGPPDQGLEIGCDGGRWSRMLVDQGWSMTCTDVDPDAIARCMRRLPEARFVQVDPEATSLPCDNDSRSLVLCISVRPVVQSEWLPHELMRVLRPGGLVVATTWNRWSWLGLVADAESRLRGRGPHEFYRQSYRAQRRRMVDAGLEMFDEEGLNWMPFRRGSNSRLLPPATRLEGRLGLRKLPAASPWVLFSARRPLLDP